MQQSVNHPDQYASADRHQVHGIPFRNHHMRRIICDPTAIHLDQNAISAREKLSITGQYLAPEPPVDSRNDRQTTLLQQKLQCAGSIDYNENRSHFY